MKNRKIRNIVCPTTDAALILAAMAGAYWLRFAVLDGMNPVGGLRYHLLWAAITAPVYLVLYGLRGVYSPRPYKGFIHECGNIVLCNTIGIMLYVDVVFFFRILDFSRWMILLDYMLLNLFVGARGFVSHRLARRRCKQGKEQKSVLVIGDGAAAEECISHIHALRWNEYRLIGTVGAKTIPGTKRLGGYDRLRSILEREQADEAIIAVEQGQVDSLGGILRQCEDSGTKLVLLPVCWEYMSRQPYFEDWGGIPLINIRRVALESFGPAALKRAIDIVGSLMLIVLTSPVMLAAAIGTRISSPGPIFFRQERIGKDKKPFYMLKFRSMRVNAESDTAWTRDGDPRRTRFGAFMRRYSIDELPQLFNVLLGDMSLVGPRPEIPKYVDHFKYSVPLYMVRHEVRPGITGWAQVNGLRGDTSIQSRVEYDLFYIENWSIWFDIKILLMTPFKGIVNEQESLVSK